MKTVYELLLPALAELGVGKMLSRANDRNQQPNSEDDGRGDELPCERHGNMEEGVHHQQDAKEDHEVGGAHGLLLEEKVPTAVDGESNADEELERVGKRSRDDHPEDAYQEEEPHLEAGHGSCRLEFKGATNRDPVMQRVQLFNRDAGGKGHKGALAVRHPALGQPVLDVLAANVTTDRCG